MSKVFISGDLGMQICYLHKKISNLYCYVVPGKSKTEYEKLCEESVMKWGECHKSGMPFWKIQEILGISRATYYRRRRFLKEGVIKSKKPRTTRTTKFNKDIYSLVLKLRRENPTYGKFKIGILLKRDYDIQISESSVGRILKKLKVPKSVSALRKKKRRVFNKHAKPFKFKEYKDMEIGENVQIDHMTVTKNGVTVKHFAAWERRSKYILANCYGNAKSSTATKFLKELIGEAPYKIRSIQVDGGSEFMAEFEDACRELDIPLMILPPASPKYNGGVERSNRVFREEFYDSNSLLEDSICGIRRELLKAVEKYNNFRPHNNLQGMTPLEYIKSVLEASDLSQTM
jgi:transposase InsO family protein